MAKVNYEFSQEEVKTLENLLAKAVGYCSMTRCNGCEENCLLTNVCYLLFEHGCTDNTVLGDLALYEYANRIAKTNKECSEWIYKLKRD